MKRSLYALAALACIAVASAMVYIAQPVFEAVSATGRFLKRLVLDGFELAGAAIEGTPVAVRLVQAKAFAVKLAQRKRPVMTASWNLFSST